MPTLKIENAKYILTLDPSRRIVRDGSILVDGRRIARVGKASEMRALPADSVIDAKDMVVTPGFINGHVHVSYAHATRGIFPDDLFVTDYLAKVFTLQSAMNEEEEYYTSLLAITELLKYGTTCFFDPGSTKFIDACMQAYEDSNCRIVLGWQVTDQPNPLNVPVTSTKEALFQIERTIRDYDHRLNDRVRVWATPFSSDFCSDGLLRGAKGLADQYGTGMTLHQANSPWSVESHLKNHGRRPIQYLEDLGVLSPNVLLAHVIGLDEAEIDSMARTGTKAVVCPTASLKSGGGTAARGKLPEMLQKGVCVSLGTDAGNNSNIVETLRALYLAAVIYKDARQNTSMVSAESAVEMATIKGAESLGLSRDVGSIEAGKKADLVLFDTMRPEWRTLFNPVNSLVYNADGRSVHTVLVDGKIVVEDHQPVFVNEKKLIEKVQELGEGLLSRTGVSFPPRWPVE